ncbi:MAG: hypothetical protein IKJ27_08355, partial [Clostridia bacterium]|nr:hypothetical protein [Clostridia bacterium]
NKDFDVTADEIFCHGKTVARSLYSHAPMLRNQQTIPDQISALIKYIILLFSRNVNDFLKIFSAFLIFMKTI